MCLPDEAAVDAVKISRDLPSSDCPIILDASSAHRVSKDWVYGLPELSNIQKQKSQIQERFLYQVVMQLVQMS